MTETVIRLYAGRKLTVGGREIPERQQVAEVHLSGDNPIPFEQLAAGLKNGHVVADFGGSGDFKTLEQVSEGDLRNNLASNPNAASTSAALHGPGAGVAAGASGKTAVSNTEGAEVLDDDDSGKAKRGGRR